MAEREKGLPYLGALFYSNLHQKLAQSIQLCVKNLCSADFPIYPQNELLNSDLNVQFFFILIYDFSSIDLIKICRKIENRYYVCIGLDDNAKKLIKILERDKIYSDYRFIDFNNVNVPQVEWCGNLIKTILYPQVHIIYGTWKGTTKAFALKLKEQFDNNNVRSCLHRGNELQPEEIFLYDSLYCFLIPTYKKGEVTEDICEVEQYLRNVEKLENAFGEPIKFTICGFGTSHHKFTYCKASHTISQLLQNKKAELIMGHMFVDYATESHFENYTTNVINLILQNHRKYVENVEPVKCDKSVYLDDFLSVKSHSTNLESNDFAQEIRLLQLDPLKCDKNYFTVKLRKVTQLCSGEITTQNCTVEVQFELPEGITYLPFFDIDVKAVNSFPAVYYILRNHILLNEGVTIHTPYYSVVDTAVKDIPPNITVFDYVAFYCNLMAPISKPWLTSMIPFILQKEEKEAITAFLANETEASEVLNKFKLSIFELLIYVAPSLKISLKTFVQISQKPADRTYSVSSSPLEAPNIFSCVISFNYTELCDLELYKYFKKQTERVERQIPDVIRNRTLNGVMSSLFCFNNENTSCPAIKEYVNAFKEHGIPLRPSHYQIKMRESGFKAPDKDKPIICIAGGSGIGPIRAIIRHRYITKSSAQLHLFFGCKNKDSHLYLQEMKQLKDQGFLTTNICTYSRVSITKRYVDQDIKIHESLFVDVMDKNDGNIYICGSTGFVKTVTNMLKNILTNYSSYVTDKIYIEEFS